MTDCMIFLFEIQRQTDACVRASRVGTLPARLTRKGIVAMEQFVFPLSLSQENIYSQEVVASGTDVNVLYFVLKARESIDPSCMEQAVNLFLQENPGARTQVTMRDAR